MNFSHLFSWSFIIVIFLAGTQVAEAQFTLRDSLQGGLRPERTCFDVKHYDLNIVINPEERSIHGYNEITFEIADFTQKIQLDLFANMVVDSIVWNQIHLPFTRKYDAVFIDFPSVLEKHSRHQLKFYYHGKPVVAKNAPWDGGFVWDKDQNNKPFIGVAVQGTGASLWFPVKDHQSDEPDEGTIIRVAVPNEVMNVSNGRLLGSHPVSETYTRWDWQVVNPINNYTITVNIGDYVHIQDRLDDLELHYYVLRDHESKARVHFEEVKPMLDCFQKKFGTYPFADDTYKLVETPYLGMEHQSAIAYGNKYLKGYLGRDMTFTGIGLLFDYITIHETAHEWFGNSVTSQDIADMWIHESFTTYAESVFVECEFGYDQAQKYINGQKRMIANRKPVIGQFGVNFKTGNSDMYYKGALMLNTLRHKLNNDELWWKALRAFALHFRHQIIETADVVNFFSEITSQDLSPFFHAYLKYATPPKLIFKKEENKVFAKWDTPEIAFEMPVEYTQDDTTLNVNVKAAQWTFMPNLSGVKKQPIKRDKFYFLLD